MAEATLRTAPAPTLFDAAFPRLLDGLSAPLRGLVLAMAGSLLLIISAKVQVPMWPVPMTMQSFVVLFLGAALGPRLGAAAVALYLGQGLAGLPVFAMPGAGGPAYFLGTTGGLAQLASGATGIGLERAFAVGVQPFVLGSLVKVALATALVAAGWSALRRR